MQFCEFNQVTTWPQFLGLVERRAEVFRIRLVHWQSPVLGTFKLNTDGCSKGNPGLSGGGGILRDVSGPFIFAFAGCFGYGTSLQAEAKALLLGLQLCVQRTMVRQLVVESDSRLLIQILTNNSQCPWSISGEVEQCFTLSKGSIQFKHCYRQANKVADILANVRCTLSDSICLYEHLSSLPGIAMGEYRLDKLAYPSIRRRRIK